LCIGRWNQTSEEELKLTDVKQILDVVYLRRIGLKLDVLTQRIEELTRILAPPLYRFQPSQRYQYKTIKAGKSDLVYKLEIPPDKVGVVTEVANTWFPNTYYMWSVDGAGKAEKVERQIATLNNPKQYDKGIVSFVGIEWEAYNNDTSDHVFEIVCDGYFMDEKIYRRIVGI
jgi:hypothetical protein